MCCEFGFVNRDAALPPAALLLAIFALDTLYLYAEPVGDGPLRPSPKYQDRAVRTKDKVALSVMSLNSRQPCNATRSNGNLSVSYITRLLVSIEYSRGTIAQEY